MKNNTEKLRGLLSMALQATPGDFALEEVKSHIRNAIQKLESVEKKREKREETRANIAPVYNPFDFKTTIDTIDGMISLEKQKLEEIANRRKKTDDGEDVQTIFG